ncbi:uncharacterized protein LOC132714797 [Ruditapes philippinarum]|uniref:uncharacterized protein LOC132714797 n=1 Tax=Ruditapes philippinarum TaxID=129788 RepID=UPI00295AC433|nr:uncharacterized protein LOC132714797 [Ruditapes philippinarum]XP_060553706.1 uncharacterized protein LOC132714797 [Ruditapes philippinarum]
MKVLALCLSLVGCVFGVTHNDLATIVNMVIADTDVDMDGFISEAELANEFQNRFDANNDGIILKNEFIHGWTTRYGDKHHHTDIFFDNIDLNGNGMIDLSDIEGNKVLTDTDADGMVSVEEYKAFIMAKHPCGDHGLDCTA